METGKIERRSGLNWDSFINEYVKPNKPVILTDASKNWGANSLFSPQYFKENFPEKTATINGVKY
nr:cupin-like domain-containing protein [Bacteroidia bacterium]